MADMDVSIIIVSWNTKDILRDCLKSVYGQTSGIDFEVIVIDNASLDGSAEMVKTEFPQAKLIANADNRGFAVANNQGIEISNGRYILLLNSDTIVLDGAIQKTVHFADEHKEAAVTACRILNKDMSLQPSCSMFLSLRNWFLKITFLYKLFPQSKFFGRAQMTWWQHNTVKEVDVVSGCFMMVRKDAVMQIGQMDEQFFMYCEEVDWCWRFKKAGWKVIFMPDAQIIHLGGASASRHGAKRAQIKDCSTVKFMFKNWPVWKAHAGLFMMASFYLSRLILLYPLYLLGVKAADKKIIDNHKSGLSGILKYRQYLK